MVDYLRKSRVSSGIGFFRTILFTHLMTTPFWHEDKVSQPLLADVNLERRLRPFVNRGKMCFQVEFLVHPMEPSGRFIRIRGSRQKPEGGAIVFRVC